MEDELFRLSPAELVVGSASPLLDELSRTAAQMQVTISQVDRRLAYVEAASAILMEHLR